MPEKEYNIEDDSYYLYASAVLKARESEFVDKLKLERMTAAASMEDFLKVFSETSYSRYLSLVSSEKNLEDVIIRANHEAVIFLKDNLKPKDYWALNLLMYEENIHNYKLVLKSIIMKEDLGYLFLPSVYSYETLLNEVSGRNFEALDDWTSEFTDLIAILAEKGKEQGNLKAEIEIEKIYFKRLFESADKSQNPVIKDFLRHIIDFINIKNIFRVKYSKIGLGFDDFILGNGFFEPESLKKFETDTIDSFAKEFKGTEYEELVSRGINTLNAHDTFVSFDKAEYMFYLKFFEPARYTVANLERILGFFIRKKIELKIINMIYMGILYGVEKYKLLHKAEILGEI